jgi:RNA polymerase sigma factor (sigma-70 family)
MIGLEHWNDIIDDHPVLEWQEQVALAKQRDEGGRRGQDALEKLVMHNLRAVVNRVERMNCRPELKADLMSAGILGLRKAAVRWQPIHKKGYDKPAPFVVYAFMWIREAVTKEAKANWHDNQSLDSDDGGGRDSIVGATEDSHDFLSADVLEILTKSERIILKSRAVDFDAESDDDLGSRLGVKPGSVNRMLFGSIRKLLTRAA